MKVHQGKDMFIGNSELYSLIDSIHDNMVISDGQGVIQWVSPSCIDTYGLKQEDFIGKTTLEMEQKRIWYPSIATLVLKNKQKITILEETKKGEKLVVTGIPIINQDNEIEKVISYSFDPTYFLELDEKYESMKNLIERYSTEIRELREKNINFPGFIAESPQMKDNLKLIMKVAAVETNLLITGESGVGKNLIALMIHQKSLRRNGPFIEINCGSIPENLLESELFGYEPGAFTGAQRSGKIGMIELAQEGTLFLDEIGELPLNLQVKLLKVIQDKTLTRIGGTQEIKVDFRLVAATNQKLESLVKEGCFREDLYYRLNVVPIHVPPLRERRDDILPMIMHFLKRANKQYEKNKTLSHNVVDILLDYDWPGNVRQLQNIIERLVILADEDHICEGSLPDSVKVSPAIAINEKSTLKRTMELVEKQMVENAYERYKTIGGVAKALGISQPSATRKVKKYITGE